jgi:hypothetical protein
VGAQTVEETMDVLQRLGRIGEGQQGNLVQAGFQIGNEDFGQGRWHPVSPCAACFWRPVILSS